jgi:hypothetical protein
MDEVGFARAVEASHRPMWRRRRLGLAASDLTIAASVAAAALAAAACRFRRARGRADHQLRKQWKP